MALPVIAIAKAAMTTNKVVNQWVPGGWKTVLGVVAGILVVAVVLPLSIVYIALSSVPQIHNVELTCSSNNSNSDGSNQDHDDGGGGGGGGNADTGYGKNKAPNVPFPEENSDTVVKPVKGSGNSSYGPRNPIRIGNVYTNKFHDGTDFGAPLGTPIVAMSDGIVSMSKSATGTAEGSMIEIQHNINGKKYTSAYRHVQGKSIKVKVGDTVKAGTKIAGVGSEGYSTGPHLHLVVAQGAYHRWNSRNGPAGTVDPRKFLDSNGAIDASGGLEGDDFSTPVDPDNPETQGCSGNNGGGNQLSGDGTTEWNTFKNGEFDEHDISKVKNISIYVDAAPQLELLLSSYKDKFKTDLKLKQGYLTKKQQQKLYDEGKQIEEAGKSVFGFARIIQFDFKNDFDSKEYKWVAENAGKYGFKQPDRYTKVSTNKDARMWSWMGVNEGMYPPSDNTAKGNQALARKILKEEFSKFDNDKEFTCLVNMWHKESGWNHKAANPVSSARGIPQAMMYWHFGKNNWNNPSNAKAQKYLNDPATQIRWGLNYIISDPVNGYGSPCEAWTAWQTKGNY